MSSGVFERKSNLKYLSVKWKTLRGSAQSTYGVTSGSGAKVSLGSRGEIGPSGVPLAKACVLVSFSRVGSVFFNAAGCTVDEVDDHVALGRAILGLFKDKRWDDDWYVITRIVHATSMSMAIADDEGATLKLEVVGNNSQIDFADSSLKMKATAFEKVSNVIVTEDAMSPLLGLSRLRRRIFGSPKFGAADLIEDDSFALREKLLLADAPLEDHFAFVEYKGDDEDKEPEG